jgi:flavin-dependent dehydrogenase
VENSFVRGVSLKNGEKLISKMVMDAEGCASTLLKQIGLQTFDKSLSVNAVNCEVDRVQDVENDMVEVYLGQKYAPGLFAWIIPRRNGSAKVGLATSVGNAREYLKQFLKSHAIARKKIGRSLVKNPSYHLISLGGPIPKTYFNGFLAVGDVASQVKPTTGGGVIMGLTCAKIAAETTCQAIERNDVSEDFLSRYQQEWQQAIGFDMAVMRQIRLMLNRLSDSQLDKVISLCSQMHLEEVLQQVRDIDFQGKALLPLLKSPAAWVVTLYAILASLT